MHRSEADEDEGRDDRATGGQAAPSKAVDDVDAGRADHKDGTKSAEHCTARSDALQPFLCKQDNSSAYPSKHKRFCSPLCTPMLA